MSGKIIIGESGQGGQEGEPVRGVDWDFVFDFRAMVDELGQLPQVAEVRWELHDPVPDFTIDTIEHGLGLVLPERVTSFFRVTDGLELDWWYTDDAGEKRYGGGCHVFDFATVFDSWLDTLWTSHAGDDAAREDFRWTLRGLDRPGLSDDEMVVFCVEEEYPTFDLFWHDLRSGATQLLDITFQDYFACLLQTRGLVGWQRLLTEDDGDPAALGDVRERLERFFPKVDPDRLGT